MLSKKQRVTRVEFMAVFSAGKRIHIPTMQIIVCASPSFHASVVVPKKVYKKAVDRNKLRRQLYAVLYEYNKKKVLSKTLILVVKPTIQGAPLSSFKPSLLSVLDSL